jgi:hypothetical protein
MLARLKRRVTRVPVVTKGGADGLRHPVDRQRLNSPRKRMSL